MNNVVAFFKFCDPLLFLLSLEVTNWEAECANEWLREADIDVVVGVAGQAWAVEFLYGQLDIEGEHGVDVRVWSIDMYIVKCVFRH